MANRKVPRFRRFFVLLLVAEGLDGVEVGGADGGNYIADEDGGRAEADSQAEATGAALEAGAAEGTGAGAAKEGDENQVKRGTRE